MRGLERVLNAYYNSEKMSLENLCNSPTVIEKQVHLSLKGTLIGIGKYEWIENDNSTVAKQRWSQGGMAYNFFNETYNSDEEYWLGADTLAWILMCDNQELYKIMYKNCKYFLSAKHNGQVWQRSMWQIACGDWEGLQESMKFLDEKVIKPNAIFHDKDIYLKIYRSFMERDTALLSEQLQLLETDKFRKARIRHITEEKYISIFTTAIAKLAWMHGMEVEVDSPYVPKELLPFEPLEEYTIPYRFLRDYYRPLGYTWRYDPVHPELQDWANDPENPDRDKKKGFLGRWFG